MGRGIRKRYIVHLKNKSICGVFFWFLFFSIHPALDFESCLVICLGWFRDVLKKKFCIWYQSLLGEKSRPKKFIYIYATLVDFVHDMTCFEFK